MMDDVYLTYMGRGPKRLSHWEHWSCPDAETYLTGVDYYRHPRQCRLRLQELYPQLRLGVPATDAPIQRPETQADQGKGRWGDSNRDYWQQEVASHRFGSVEDMLKFSPLAQADFTGWRTVEEGDFGSEDVIFRRYRKNYPAEWGDHAPEGSSASVLWRRRSCPRV